jgi:uncharacterized protein DUF6875
MTTATLAEPQTAVEQKVRDWLINEMAAPHPLLGRPGPVCPYLSSALARDLVIVRSSPWRQHERAPKDAVTAVIRQAVALFHTRPWPAERPDLRAVVAVLPEMPDKAWPAVDAAHAAAKTAAAERGLMLGQFHPRCETGAVHNPDFRVLRSPYPLLVVRQMALHDVLFLHQDRRQFAAYVAQFGHRYNHPGTPAALAQLYHQAQQRYSRRPAGRRRARAPRNAA